MFPADDAAHGEDAAEELIEDAVHLGVVGPSADWCHEVDVDVAVTGMTEAGDGNAIFLLEQAVIVQALQVKTLAVVQVRSLRCQ